ncbi:MAG: FHA domain-containing protein [Leptolyngbya sp. SIO4C1]|nr:FHA domain-containing protein [Leptolyngbya sp. SIO4C1]
MIICPNCNHQNPAAAMQCEACYTPLPEKAACPHCGATIQSDASFCGQCGADLRTHSHQAADASPPPESPAVPESIAAEEPSEAKLSSPERVPLSVAAAATAVESPSSAEPAAQPARSAKPAASEMPAGDVPASEVSASEVSASEVFAPQTQLQRSAARLLHVQTDAILELPQQLSLVRIGKPNERIPPDLDISGFPDSEIVSRVHASIRVEGDLYYIEDVGSSNGTYINNLPLPSGNRHRLRPGDRIALGKGDKVSFIFQFA